MSKPIPLKRSEDLESLLKSRIESGERLTIVKAPPGSGKTHLLVETVWHAVQERKMRIAIAAQTNSQADEICTRIHEKSQNLGRKIDLVRFVGSGHHSSSTPLYKVSHDQDDLPGKKFGGVAVATSAKWGAIQVKEVFDLLCIEEAWQLKLAGFLPLCEVAGKFLLIGDPGQIPPVVTIDTARWSTGVVPPHLPAPEVILNRHLIEQATPLEIHVTRRLPQDTAELVKAFYDFGFSTHEELRERSISFGKSIGSKFSKLGDVLEGSSIAGLTLETPKNGPPLEADRDIAKLAAETIQSVLDSKAETQIADEEKHLLIPTDIGIAATHRSMVQELKLTLPSSIRDQIMVDTAERWQGLERRLMLIVHPLSGVTRPSDFDLGTGRLCVMASRHKIGLIVLGRDHIAETLETYDPAADQPLGLRDENGRGHAANRHFIRKLIESEKWLKIA